MRAVNRVLTGAIALTCLMASGCINAQNYPSKTLRVIIGYPAGSGNDVIARLVMSEVSKGIGQQVIIDNRPGGAATIGMDLTAKSPPDGHTFLIIGGGFAINPSMYRKLPFDPLNDFTPISLLATVPGISDSEEVLAKLQQWDKPDRPADLAPDGHPAGIETLEFRHVDFAYLDGEPAVRYPIGFPAVLAAARAATQRALDRPLAAVIDVDAIAFSTNYGVFFSLDQDITITTPCGPMLLQDGAIAMIPNWAITYTADFRVASVLPNSAFVLYDEPAVDAMVANAQVTNRFGACLTLGLMPARTFGLMLCFNSSNNSVRRFSMTCDLFDSFMLFNICNQALAPVALGSAASACNRI